MQIEQEIIKRKKIIMSLFVIIFILSSFVFVKFLLNRMNTYIEVNGEISMESVVEQIQQTYDMQVSGYYRQLHFVEDYLCKEKKISLETDNNRNFFKAWEKESESTLLFLQENGKAITSDGTKLKVDMPSKLLLDLRNGSNIEKLVAFEFEQVKKDGYLVAIPCQEYTINGETYTAIGTVYDHSKLDSMLNLGGYDGSAYLFMLDDDGNITYTNQKDDIFFRNYSLLKHLKSNHAITEKEFDSLNKKIAEGKKGVELLGKDKPYYLGYCPIESNNTMLIYIVKKEAVNNVLKEYQKTIGFTTMLISLIRHNAGDKEKVIEYADKIAISSQHLLGIINDVLDMSKIEAGKTVFKYSDFSILDFIEELNTIFHSQANEKNQSFIIKKENLKHEWVNGDKVHLMQIFSNLLSNAIKYTQEGGIIQFIAEESETNSSTYGKYHFIVSDNGMGMSADFKETIFDAFTRAESSVTNKIQGTGLGMAITKNLVESMGGTIEVESEPNRGSRFEVILNLKIVENRVVSSTEQIEMHETDSDILDGMRFLCAEDNELNAEILMELLKFEGAECTICENGKRILEAFEQSVPGEYDMILMDVQMPVMNGYEATEAIRRSSHEQAKTIPIIAMTANAFSEDMQHSFAAGMNAHISKPVDMKLLKKTIRNIKLGREEAKFIDQ